MPKVILDVKLYSLKEVAELLDVTLPSVTKYINTGRLSSTRIGGKKYVTEEMLKSFLTQGN